MYTRSQGPAPSETGDVIPQHGSPAGTNPPNPAEVNAENANLSDSTPNSTIEENSIQASKEVKKPSNGKGDENSARQVRISSAY